MSTAEMIKFHQCLDCGTLDASCISTCAKCLSSNMAELGVAGDGRLVSWTTIRKPPMRFKADGVYDVCVVDLDNGFRVTGRFIHADGDEIGDRVVAITNPNENNSTPVFRTEKNA